jgi:putative membrane protein
MNRTILFVVAAAAMGLSGCVSTPAPTSMAMMTSTAQFVPTATASNTFEIESSRIALRKSRDPEVRRFANQMIRDHSRAARQMVASARSAGIAAPPAALDSRHQTMVDQLAAAPAGQFDALYVQMQQQAHQEAVALFTAYSQGGDNPTMVAFAQETLPTLQMHYQHIQGIMQQAQ